MLPIVEVEKRGSEMDSDLLKATQIEIGKPGLEYLNMSY